MVYFPGYGYAAPATGVASSQQSTQSTASGRSTTSNSSLLTNQAADVFVSPSGLNAGQVQTNYSDKAEMPGFPAFNAYFRRMEDSLNNGVVPSLEDMLRDDPLQNMEPEAPETQQMQARLAALFSTAPGSDYRLQQYFMASAQKSLTNINGVLRNIASNIVPDSPEGQQLQQRIAAIDAINQSFTPKLAESLQKDPSHGQAISLHTDNGSMIRGSMYPQYLQQQLQQGHIPSLEEMTRLFPSPVDINTPEGQGVVHHMIRMLASAGPEGDIRAQEFGTVMAGRSLDNISGTLNTVLQNIEPGSPDALAVQDRLRQIAAVKQQVQAQLPRLIAQDPSQGQAINLNSSNDQNINSLMSQLLMGLMTILQRMVPQG